MQETGDRCDDVLRAEALNQDGSSFNVWQILAEIKGVTFRYPLLAKTPSRNALANEIYD